MKREHDNYCAYLNVDSDEKDYKISMNSKKVIDE